MEKLQTSVDRINNQQDSKEKCIFPAQPQPNTRGHPQGGPSTSSNNQQEKVNAVTVLRSGKVIGQENIPSIEEIDFELKNDNENMVEIEEEVD